MANIHLLFYLLRGKETKHHHHLHKLIIFPAVFVEDSVNKTIQTPWHIAACNL